VTPRVYAVGGGAVSLGTKRVPRSPSRRPLPSTLLYLPVSLWLSSVVRRPLLRVRIFSSAVLLSFRRISLFPLVFSLFPLHFLLPLIFLSFGYISLFPLQFSPSALSLPFSVTFFFFFFQSVLLSPHYMYPACSLFLCVSPRFFATFLFFRGTLLPLSRSVTLSPFAPSICGPAVTLPNKNNEKKKSHKQGECISIGDNRYSSLTRNSC
jgi:hypothetical protein